MSWPERIRNASRAGEVGRWLGLVPPVVFFCLAVIQLTRLPLWWDEGHSLDYLDRSLSAIAALDTHPPGYDLVLLVWTRLLGRSPFAIRVLSSLIGTLAVAVFGWAMGRIGAGSSRAQASDGAPMLPVLSALLLACSPFLLHHAREARMYALAVALAAVSLGLLAPLLAAPRPRRRTWVGYTLTLAAGLYVHLGFIAVIVAEAAAVALSLGRWPNRWRAWLGVAVGLAVGFAPWGAMLAFARGVVLSDTRLEAGARVDVATTALEVARQIAIGPYGAGSWWGWAPLIVLGGLAVAGLGRWRGRAPETVALAGLAVLGIAGAGRINYGLAGDVAVAARLGFAAVPGLLGLAAVGLAGLAGRWRAPALGLAVAVCVPGLGQVLTQPIDPEEDMRPVIAYVQSLARPGDAYLYTFRWQNGDLSGYWPDHPLQPVLRYYDRADVAAFVAGLEAAHARLWILNYRSTWGDPSDAIYPVLEARAAIADRRLLGATEVVLVVFVPQLSDPTPAQRPVGEATLGFEPLSVQARAGDTVPVRVRWSNAPATANTFLHLGLADAPPLAQSDRAIASLAQGEFTAALLIPPGTPQGRYAVFAGLYDPATGARAPVPSPAGCDTVDRLCLGTVDVVP